MRAGFVHRVAARDHALLERLALDGDAARLIRAAWLIITHAGGAVATLLVSVGPLLFDSPLSEGARAATLLLVSSHVLVQLVKRSVGRPRPVLSNGRAARSPDRFSFPSGHAAAALAVAIGYSSAYPDLALPLVAGACIAGGSRVVLVVHFPADVVAGQILSLITAVMCAPLL